MLATVFGRCSARAPTGIRPARWPQVRASAEFDEKAADLDDDQLKKATQLLDLDDLADSADIPQFLAIAREAAERTTTLRPFDVQLLGALRMLAGDVVEMATGEGKTLSGAIAAAGYALAGRHVHVVTINDYLARRDAEWMGPLIEAMGLTVGWITAESTADERRAAYKCDVTYASVNEIGFDVLRDQLVTDVADLVSPNPDVALIDEADSVLVDEALVPLVLAGHHAPGNAEARNRPAGGRIDRPAMTTTPTPTVATSTSPRTARRSSRPHSAASTCTPKSTSAPR